MFKLELLEFGTGNQAFADGDGQLEVVRILQQIITKVRAGNEEGIIMDINGNRVGQWSMELPAPEVDEDDKD